MIISVAIMDPIFGEPAGGHLVLRTVLSKDVISIGMLESIILLFGLRLLIQ